MFFYKDNELIIRSMNSGDIPIILNNFTEQGWHKPKQVLERYFNGQNQNSLHIFIAEYNNDIAGYTVLYPDTDTGPFALQKIPVISDFIVFEKYQRKGIGNKILDIAEKKAAESNTKVQLSVGLHSGYGAAQRIYIKRGYIPDGSGVWYKNKQLDQYAECKNDDDLVLILIKELHIKYIFQPANYDDIPEIVNIYHSLIGTPGCTWDLEYPSKESAESDISNESLYVLRTKNDNKIIAVASAGNFDELSHLQWKPKKPCELARIGVIPTMQKQGIGTIILQNIIDKMKEKGFDGIRMLVSKTNPAALALYDKNGFENCGETFMFDINFYCYQKWW